MTARWLQGLKLDELRRIATLIGSPCSGTKPIRIHGIEEAIKDARALAAYSELRRNGLRIVSIDMGIRNLAYCALSTPLPVVKHPSQPPFQVNAWQRLALNHEATKSNSNTSDSAMDVEAVPATAVKESFEPSLYAKYAYDFTRRVIDEHQPSHVLIERQRFRSGGGSAVQEWSLRVGMLEAMLYACFRTLKEQHITNCEVLPMSPASVNRFWLDDKVPMQSLPNSTGKKSERVKQQKIKLVADLIEQSTTRDLRLTFSLTASATRDTFPKHLQSRKTRSDTVGIVKLDDLADSLLQGLAWVLWLRNRTNLDLAKEQTILTELAVTNKPA
jgi:cruciform cutting endonuclease 1